MTFINIMYKLSLTKSWILLFMYICIRYSYRIPSYESSLYLYKLRNIVHIFAIVPDRNDHSTTTNTNAPNDQNFNNYNKKVNKSTYTVRRNNEILTSRKYKDVNNHDIVENSRIYNSIMKDDFDVSKKNNDHMKASQVFSPYRSKRQRIRYGKSLLITSRMNHHYNTSSGEADTELQQQYRNPRYKNNFIQQKHSNHNSFIEGSSGSGGYNNEFFNSNIEDRRNQQQQNPIGSMSIKNIISECSDFNTKPAYSHLNLDFDYLSSNTLHTIQLLPNHRKSKGEFY